jgi:hypothetical protein
MKKEYGYPTCARDSGGMVTFGESGPDDISWEMCESNKCHCGECMVYLVKLFQLRNGWVFQCEL